jgi:hypothetical protein
MKKGRVFLNGTFENLKDNDYLIKILKIHNNNKDSSNQQNNIQDTGQSESENELKE